MSLAYRRVWRTALLTLVAAFFLAAGGVAEERKLPELLDLMDLEGFERSQEVLRLCAGATPEHLKTLLEVAEQPDIAARHYGQIGLALKRLVTEEALNWGIEKAKHDDPVVRHLAVAVVAAVRGDAARKALLDARQSSHSEVRAAAALALRHCQDPEALEALKEPGTKDETATERSCAMASLEWLAGARRVEATPARRLVVLADAKPETLKALEGAGVVSVPDSSKALVDPKCSEAVLARLKAGATLHLMFSRQSGQPVPAADQLLKGLGLAVPAVNRSGATSYVCNLAEPHPLQDCVHDLYGWRIWLRAKDPEAVSHAASELAEWSQPSSLAFVNWDRKVWAAPFCGLTRPDLACVLDAPPMAERGRVVLDLTGVRFAGPEIWPPPDLETAQLRLWEFGNNFKAFLQGPGALVPLKNIYRGSYGAMKLIGQMPAPYFDVDESVVTPHVPWAKPLAGGPVPVGFLVPEIMVRTAIEIRQRMDVQPTWLPFAEKFFGGQQQKGRRGPPVIDAGSAMRLKRYLDGAGGSVLVIPAFEDSGGFFQKEYVCSWAAFLPDLRLEVLRAVRGGMGLVAIGPAFPGDPVALAGAQRIEAPADILQALPLDAAKAGESLACYSLGKGRIVHFRPTVLCGKVRSGLSLGPAFLVPGLMSPYAERVSTDEYVFACCCAAIYWAAGRSQQTQPAAEVRIVDRFGRRFPAVGRQTAEGAPRTDLAGPAIEESRHLDEKGQVTGWSARRIGPDKAIQPKVSLGSRVIEVGDPLRATVDAASIDGGQELLAEVIDLHGRIVCRRTFPVQNGRTAVEMPPWRPVARWHDLYVAGVLEGKTVADAMWPFTVDVPPADHRKDLCLYVLPGPTVFVPGMKATGVSGTNGSRDHFIPFLPDVPGNARQAVQAWHPHDTVVRSGLEFRESFQWMAVPTGEKEGEPSPADPTAHAQMRRMISDMGSAYKVYGMRRAILCDEFALPGHASFSPAIMAAFRRAVRLRYGSLDKLNAAWDRKYASWAEVCPDMLEAAVKRKNLVSWAQHRDFMETQVADWCEEADRLLQEQVPGASAGLSNASRGPDSGVNFEKLMRAGSLCAQYSYMDRALPRDLGRPEMVLGYWEPVTFDQTLPEKAQREALFMVNRYLLDQHSTHLIWWGFCDFQWPFLRPDLTPACTFRPMLEERKTLQAGIDRVVLGAKLDNAQVASLFSQASWRTLHALEAMAGRKLPVAHNWDGLMGVLGPVLVRGHAISMLDLRRGRLDREKPKLLFLSGVVAMNEDCVAELERYVGNGGRIIADVLPAAYTEESAPQDQSRIARLFGIAPGSAGSVGSAGSAGILPVSAPGTITADGPFRALSSITRKLPPLTPDMKPDGGTAFGRVEETPALIENKTGKGKTLLLNFMLDQVIAVGEWDPIEAKVAAVPVRKAVAEAISGWAGLESRMAVFCEAQGAPPYPGHCVYVYRDGEKTVLGLFCDGWFGGWERKVTVTLPEERFLYDLRSPGPPQEGKEFTVTVPKWQAGYFVLTPLALPDMEVSLERGADGNLHVRLSGGGGRRVALIRPRDGSGAERPELAAEVDFVSETTVVVPVALNDPPGNWRIDVRDVMTGQSVEKTLKP